MCTRALTRPISPGKTLASKEIIQSWIAECAADIQAALLKGKYTTAATSFVPELDPYLYYP
jgi:hypothetical protein